ncbi:hypothetical protein F4604DRAFT_1706599 [Suillus subluteus]|nr:hypothetical protein F4604DRAFT_1706599 [Suillus subluteus]
MALALVGQGCCQRSSAFTSFLVFATPSRTNSSDAFPSGPVVVHALDPKRYERTSELVKAFKLFNSHAHSLGRN